MPHEINNRWFGVLTNDNIEGVVAVVREILQGRFAIAEALNCDSEYTTLRLISADCATDSQWTSEPYREQVRLFADSEDGHKWFGFSAGGYSWSFTAQSDATKDHEDYRYPYFSFEYDKFTVTERAPAGKGCLHRRVFGERAQSRTYVFDGEFTNDWMHPECYSAMNGSAREVICEGWMPGDFERGEIAA